MVATAPVFEVLIQAAIRDALNEGRVDRSSTWQGWDFFGQHLFPNKIPDQERATLVRMLSSSREANRNEVLRFLISDDGLSAFLKERSEKGYHQALYAEGFGRHQRTAGGDPKL